MPRNDNETSRFIIQKHPFNGEWQLTEIYHSIHRRTIHSFTKKNENENAVQGKTIAEVFVTFLKHSLVASFCANQKKATQNINIF